MPGVKPPLRTPITSYVGASFAPISIRAVQAHQVIDLRALLRKIKLRFVCFPVEIEERVYRSRADVGALDFDVCSSDPGRGSRLALELVQEAPQIDACEQKRLAGSRRRLATRDFPNSLAA